MERLSEEQIKGQVLDHLGLIAATIKKLGLVEKIDARLTVSAHKGSKVSMGQRVAAMLLNGLGFIDDRLYMFPDFLANKPVEQLLGEGVSAEHFNDDALGRALDAIYGYGTTKLFTEIAFAIGVEQELLGHSAHFDTSTLSVYGDYAGDEGEKSSSCAQAAVDGATAEEVDEPRAGPLQITYGYAKNKRFDLKQMVINLATTGAAGFPIWMEAHNGNASDKTILLEAAGRMKRFCAQLKEAPDFLYVGDSAMYAHAIKQGGDMKWLSRVPETIAEAKALLRQADTEFSWQETGNGYKITPIASTYGGIQQRWLMVYSEQAYAREIKTLDKQIAREQATGGKALWHLARQPFDCEQDARKAAEAAIKLKYHKVTFEISAVSQHARPGRPKRGEAAVKQAYFIAGTLTADEARITQASRAKGRFILATNELATDKLPDTALLPEYKGQSKTESGFRFIKGHAFEVSSVFLKKPERIEALMMIMTLCLLVYSLAQHALRQALKAADETIPNQLKKPTQRPTLAWICRLFHGVQVLHIQLADHVQRLVINLTDTTKRIIHLFGPHALCIYGLAPDG